MRSAEDHVYYNEIADFPAKWLAELAAVRAIPAGRIDGRPIQEVAAGDVASFDVCHFFAGIGVWSYALEQSGWPRRGIKTWTASLPCQPWSRAGRGNGLDDARDLWPIFFDLVQQCEPSVILGEQVSGPDGRAWLDRVFADLEGIGFAVAAIDSPACGVGAPQIRQRQYWLAARLADAQSIERELQRSGRPETARWKEPPRNGGASAAAMGTTGYWGDAHWHECVDQFSRPVGPGLRTLASRSPGAMDVLRGYGNALNAESAVAFAASAREALAGFDPPADQGPA